MIVYTNSYPIQIDILDTQDLNISLRLWWKSPKI